MSSGQRKNVCPWDFSPVATSGSSAGEKSKLVECNKEMSFVAHPHWICWAPEYICGGTCVCKFVSSIQSTVALLEQREGMKEREKEITVVCNCALLLGSRCKYKVSCR